MPSGETILNFGELDSSANASLSLQKQLTSVQRTVSHLQLQLGQLQAILDGRANPPPRDDNLWSLSPKDEKGNVVSEGRESVKAEEHLIPRGRIAANFVIAFTGWLPLRLVTRPGPSQGQGRVPATVSLPPALIFLAGRQGGPFQLHDPLSGNLLWKEEAKAGLGNITHMAFSTNADDLHVAMTTTHSTLAVLHFSVRRPFLSGEERRERRVDSTERIASTVKVAWNVTTLWEDPATRLVLGGPDEDELSSDTSNSKHIVPREVTALSCVNFKGARYFAVGDSRGGIGVYFRNGTFKGRTKVVGDNRASTIRGLANHLSALLWWTHDAFGAFSPSLLDVVTPHCIMRLSADVVDVVPELISPRGRVALWGPDSPGGGRTGPPTRFFVATASGVIHGVSTNEKAGLCSIKFAFVPHSARVHNSLSLRILRTPLYIISYVSDITMTNQKPSTPKSLIAVHSQLSHNTPGGKKVSHYFSQHMPDETATFLSAFQRQGYPSFVALTSSDELSRKDVRITELTFPERSDTPGDDAIWWEGMTGRFPMMIALIIGVCGFQFYKMKAGGGGYRDRAGAKGSPWDRTGAAGLLSGMSGGRTSPNLGDAADASRLMELLEKTQEIEKGMKTGFTGRGATQCQKMSSVEGHFQWGGIGANREGLSGGGGLGVPTRRTKPSCGDDSSGGSD